MSDVSKKIALWAAVAACLVLLHLGYQVAGFVVLAAVGASTVVLNWREKRHRKKWFIKARKFCVEPTFEHHMLELGLGDETTWEMDKHAEEMRDEMRRLIVREAIRFRNRYGKGP